LTVEARSREIAERFEVGGPVLSVDRHGDGHINATYVVTAGTRGGASRRYVLQRINRSVFRDPEAVVRNAERVTGHLRSKVLEEGGRPEREVLRLVRTADGAAPFARDGEGEVWRCYAMIERASAHSTVANPKQARTVGSAFGRFLRRLSDFPAHELEITLPGLHDAVAHLRALRGVARDDPLGRAAEVQGELAFVEARRRPIETWMDLLSSGDVPTRAIHSDTKVSNVLLDEDTGRGVCVIDLDTVMPGSALVDVGDFARSVLTGPEGIGRGVDLALFGAAVRGYLGEAGRLLAETEIEHVVQATRMIALELGIRFLADHVAGDRWFPVGSPGENLARSRVQLDLARRIEERDDEMTAIVRRAVARSRRWRRRRPTTGDALRYRIDGGRTRP
jgi:Ser/Thr protein kinase RdoA (MazF antagonist)